MSKFVFMTMGITLFGFSTGSAIAAGYPDCIMPTPELKVSITSELASNKMIPCIGKHLQVHSGKTPSYEEQSASHGQISVEQAQASIAVLDAKHIGDSGAVFMMVTAFSEPGDIDVNADKMHGNEIGSLAAGSDWQEIGRLSAEVVDDSIKIRRKAESSEYAKILDSWEPRALAKQFASDNVSDQQNQHFHLIKVDCPAR